MTPVTSDPLARRAGVRQYMNDALRDYYEIGSGRSLAKLHAAYTLAADANPTTVASWQSRGPEPPTTNLRNLEKWSSRHNWQDRVAARAKMDAESRDTRRLEARVRIEDEALEDADALRAMLRASLQEVRAQLSKIGLEVGAGVDGEPSVTVTVDVDSLNKATTALDRLDQVARRSLGLPEHITASDVDMTSDGQPLHIKLQWDDAAGVEVDDE